MGWHLLLPFFNVPWKISYKESHVSVYLDDILVTGATEQEHLDNLDKVLSTLEAAGMRLQHARCAFLLPAMEYLGHKISAQGL